MSKTLEDVITAAVRRALAEWHRKPPAKRAPKPLELSPEDLDALRNGEKAAVVAARLGFSPVSVRHAAHRAGVTLTKGRPHGNDPTLADRDAAIVAATRAGEPHADIARRHKLTRERVRQIAKTYGGKTGREVQADRKAAGLPVSTIRPRGANVFTLTPEECAELEAGGTASAIAIRRKVSLSTILEAAQWQGVHVWTNRERSEAAGIWARNAAIYAAHLAGDSNATLAARFSIPKPSIAAILTRQRKKATKP